jgi:hypothetical protein
MRAFLAVVTCSAILSGCGHEFPIAPTRGVVTLKGQPVTAGRVVLLPVGGGKHALGTIGPEGAFVLSSYGEGDGAQVGENHVLVLDVSAPGQSDAVNYRAAKSHSVHVKPDRENVLAIDIKPGTGWHVIEDD